MYLIKYRRTMVDKTSVVYHIEISAKDKKDAIKKAAKRFGMNNLISIYLKLN